MLRFSRGGLALPDRFRKLITPEQAARLVKSNDTLCASGFVAQGCPDRLLRALEERFAEDGKPAGLTLLFGGGPGDYGVKGLNRLATRPGMLKRTIGGHYGQVPEIAKRVLNNEIAGWALPMGSVSKMMRCAASHTPDHVTRVGLGTFVDPRHRGGALNELAEKDPNQPVDLTHIGGNEYLRYKTMPIRVALIRATTADTHGNLTMERESLLGDNRIMATAVRASGGIVIAQVNRLAAANSLNAREVHVPGQLVDYIVEVPDEPMSFFTRYDPARSGEIRIPTAQAGGKTTSKNITAHPKDAKEERRHIARRAALELNVHDIVNLGIGMPEGVARVAQEEQMLDHITLTTEAGVVGGQACSGHEFGPGINFDAIVEMNAQFDFYNGGGLNCAFLGMGQVGQNGCVNVSRLSKDKLTGPGGFMDIVQNTRKVVFVGTFFKKGQSIKTLQKTCGFESTFDGPRALQAGQEVLYVTERAVFRLDHGGLRLIEIAPGLDVKKDILAHLDFEPIVDPNIREMDPRIFDLDNPLGLADEFFNIKSLVRKRVEFFPKENLFFANLSRLSMLNENVIEEFIEAFYEQANEVLNMSGKRRDERMNIVVKIDNVRIPPGSAEKARATFRARFEAGFPDMNLVFWRAREHLDQLLENQTSFIEDSNLIQLLWLDWTRGSPYLDRTQLRAHLESELDMRVRPEHLSNLMGDRDKIAFNEFPALVRKLQDRLSW